MDAACGGSAHISRLVCETHRSKAAAPMLSRAAGFGTLLTGGHEDDKAVGFRWVCGPAALGLANEQQTFLRRALEASSSLAQCKSA